MHTTGAWIVPPTSIVEHFDRETLDGALIGLARVARSAAALLLMCDPRDVGVVAQAQAPHTLRPTLFLYDAVPGGVGLAERLHQLNAELITACARMVGDCECPDGCPSCVGPIAEVGVRGKSACLELLEALAA